MAISTAQAAGEGRGADREGGCGFANQPMIMGGFWIPVFAGAVEKAGWDLVARAGLGVEPLVPSAPSMITHEISGLISNLIVSIETTFRPTKAG